MNRSFFFFSLLLATCLAGPVPLNKAEEDAILLLEKTLPKEKPPKTIKQDKNVMDQILEANQELNMFEGDILGVSARTMTRNAIRDVTEIWTSRIIPFVIKTDDYSCTEVELIREAMEEYHLRTCLQFVSRTNQPDYIHIKKNTGCRSYVGVQGGEQEVSFGNGCMHKGIMMHELMHAVGFWHEHSRSDRDEWVAINWDNVQDGQEQNFIKHSQTEVDTLGAPYDYGSIMHYSASSFSKSGLPTIVARNPTDETLGQRDGFSTTDVQKINQLYSCHCHGPGSPPGSTWLNDFPPPGSQLISTNPVGVHPDCGSSFLGGPSGEIKSPMHPLDYPDFLNCRWLINATGTEPIILSFKEFSVEAGGAGCIYDALKVYDGTDESAPLLGTYCGETNPLDVTSSGGQMFITFSSDSSYTERGFIIQYSSGRIRQLRLDPPHRVHSVRTDRTVDHTTGLGHYLFIEASSPQEVGHNAILRSPIYPPSSTGYCLDFHYHMYGVNVGDLNVYLFTEVGQGEPLWSMSGNQGNQWIRARISIKPTRNFQLMFEAIRGTDWRGDIAIDDIKLVAHPCV
uniref:Metalloendopeptidase n=1 Tax=Branchiostoma floridae TaxID=7739 RepID=C3XV86_BRAFL|eukprot:XP_002612003.1 hypothetical protein BRAFLDRAFT_86962 [Branchiostoma floridae]